MGEDDLRVKPMAVHMPTETVAPPAAPAAAPAETAVNQAINKVAQDAILSLVEIAQPTNEPLKLTTGHEIGPIPSETVNPETPVTLEPVKQMTQTPETYFAEERRGQLVNEGDGLKFNEFEFGPLQEKDSKEQVFIQFTGDVYKINMNDPTKAAEVQNAIKNNAPLAATIEGVEVPLKGKIEIATPKAGETKIESVAAIRSQELFAPGRLGKVERSEEMRRIIFTALAADTVRKDDPDLVFMQCIKGEYTISALNAEKKDEMVHNLELVANEGYTFHAIVEGEEVKVPIEVGNVKITQISRDELSNILSKMLESSKPSQTQKTEGHGKEVGEDRRAVAPSAVIPKAGAANTQSHVTPLAGRGISAFKRAVFETMKRDRALKKAAQEAHKQFDQDQIRQEIAIREIRRERELKVDRL